MSSLLLPSCLFISRRTLSSPLRLRSNPNPNPNPNSRFRSLSLAAKMEDASSIPGSAAVANGGSAPGSAAGSLKAEGILSGGSALAVDPAVDAEFGFGRAEFRKDPLVATAGPAYDRHVFLCYKSPESWPSHLEAADSDRLPRLLSAALKARKDDMAKRTRLTICGGEDGTESSNGDVLIFPDMIRYRQLTHFDIDNFVEEVLVKDTEWLPGSVEKLTGSYVFICAHGSRDRRCGVCAPPLIKKFEEEIKSRGLQGQVSVSPCSHVGGHKYAGNAIIFSRNMKGEVTGHWYGYVSPDDVPALLDQHIGKGEVIDHLWRGQMGLSAEEQKEALKLRKEKIAKTGVDPVANGGGCCQGIGGSACCQTIQAEKPEDKQAGAEKAVAPKKSNTERNSSSSSSNKGAGAHKPTWFESWEREDTYAALAVFAAIASVAVAFSYYRQLR